MKYGDKIRITNGIFKGMVGELIGINSSSHYFNGNGDSKTLVIIQLDENNEISVSIDDIEVVDNFPKSFEQKDDLNFISVRSNFGSWDKSVEEYNKNKDSDVIFLETDNYSDDNEEIVHMFSSLSVPQARFLIEKLGEIVEYIEYKSC